MSTDETEILWRPLIKKLMTKRVGEKNENFDVHKLHTNDGDKDKTENGYFRWNKV